jgi:hypothetical protein
MKLKCKRGCTLIAGILHLSLASDVLGNNLPVGLFFVIAGIAQVFWTLPILRSWVRMWTYVGIGGTVILIIIWIITRFPDNPIIGIKKDSHITSRPMH